MPATFEEILARCFSMSEETWERHANPWSVWTRFTILPLLTLAIWSRIWIGPWAWGCTGLVLVWTWINPRLFRKPRSTTSWASRAVLGERVWINRRTIPVPRHHHKMAIGLSWLAGSGTLFLIWGIWQLHPWATLMGIVLVYTGKLWFLDRMVWLYEDMKETTPEYRTWSKTKQESEETA